MDNKEYISSLVAKSKIAQIEFEKFNKQQRIESDFDREVKKLLQKKGAKE